MSNAAISPTKSGHNASNTEKKSEITSQGYFEPSSVLIFDITGPNAHFRNIQTNSSSLSYYFPPPTTLSGLIAGILGFQRDSYYTQFSPANVFFALDILTPLRKLIQTVNYRVYDEAETTQIPMEIIVPENSAELKYRIYFSHKESSLYQNLKALVLANKSIYPPYLGISEFIASTEFIEEVKCKKAEIGEKIKVNSVLRSAKLNITTRSNELVLFPEYMRENFQENRVPGDMIQYYFLAKGTLEIKIQPENPFYLMQGKKIHQYVCRL